MARWAFVATAGLALVLGTMGGCSSDDAGTQGAVARFTLTAGQTPPFLDVPYPTDAYLKDGHVMNPLPGLDAVVTQNADILSGAFAELDGFSRFTHALFYVDDMDAAPVDDAPPSAVIDKTSLPADEDACVADTSSVYLLDMDAPDPAHARVRCRAYFQDDAIRGSDTRPVVAVGPARGIVLEEGHHYAALLTSRLQTADGRAVRASADLTNLPTTPEDATQRMYRDALDRAVALLGPGLGGARIVAIAPFTTHTRARELFQLRATLDTEPIPPLSFDPKELAPMGAARFARPVGGVLPAGFTASLDDWLGVVDPKNKLPDGSDDWDNQLPVRAHDYIAAWGTAVFEASSYLRDEPGGYDNPLHAHFARDASGNIVRSPTKPTAKIWASIAVPDAPMPPGGYPTVIVQHGLGASREYLVQAANVFCTKGWMVVGVDSITFGARAVEPEFQVDEHTDYESAPGATYKGPDGIADNTPSGRNPPTDLFGNLLNLGAFRDQLRQAAIDTVSLVRVLRNHPDLSPLKTGATVPAIDPDHIAYVGESLGSIEGEMAAAIEPHVHPWVFSVGGGGFIMEAAVHGPGIGTLLGAAAGLYFHFLRDRLTEFHPLVNLVQTAVEPADPLLYAGDLIRHPQPVGDVPPAPRDVLLIESLYDELVANEAGEAWARAAGLGLAEPNVGSNAGITDLQSLEAGGGHVPLPSIGPDASGTIHDVPLPGITGLVVQAGPCDHGSDWVSSKGQHQFAIPYVRYDDPVLYDRLPVAFDMRNPYRALAQQITDFIGDRFAGKAPGVVVHQPPVRDFDDDGVKDDVDPDPSDPSVK